MMWVLGVLAVALLAHVWLCIRVGRSSTALAIITLFIGPLAAVYTLIRHRGDDEASVTVPFVASGVCWLALGAVVWQVILPALAEQERAFQASLAPVPRAGTPPTTVRERQPESTPGVIRLSLPPTAAVTPASTPAATPAVPDTPARLFSEALNEAGLSHTLGKVLLPAQLPPGVGRATQLSVVADGRAAYPVTLFECESPQACRHLAGVQMQQAAERRRVLQNGLLLLSTPVVALDDSDLTLAAVASVFRKLPS